MYKWQEQQVVLLEKHIQPTTKYLLMNEVFYFFYFLFFYVVVSNFNVNSVIWSLTCVRWEFWSLNSSLIWLVKWPIVATSSPMTSKSSSWCCEWTCWFHNSLSMVLWLSSTYAFVGLSRFEVARNSSESDGGAFNFASIWPILFLAWC